MECCKDPSKQTLQWSYDFGGNNSSTPTIGIHRQSFDQIARISNGGSLLIKMRDGMLTNICGIDSINKGHWW